jgi:N-glycosylase/DNA lyase
VSKKKVRQVCNVFQNFQKFSKFSKIQNFWKKRCAKCVTFLSQISSQFRQNPKKVAQFSENYNFLQNFVRVSV